MEDSEVEVSDRASGDGVESEGSVSSSSGQPSLRSSSAAEYADDETTYRRQFIEEEKAEQRKEQTSTKCRRLKIRETSEAILQFGNISKLGSN